MELAQFLVGDDFLIFLLLFVRLTSMFAFLPFFSHMNIPVAVKGAFSFWLSLLFFPLVTSTALPLTTDGLVLAILTEALLGFVAGLVLQFVFAMLSTAGDQISMVVGFSMATVFDPQTGQSSQVISQFLTMIMLLVLLAFDGHHMMIAVIASSFQQVPLGGFVLTPVMFDYFINAMKHLFIMSFVLSFPIVAFSLLSDIIFGMIMKTMPGFNLMVVGFPIKIVLSIIIIMVILAPMSVVFHNEFLIVLDHLRHFF